MSLENFRSSNKESDIPIKCAWAGRKVKTEDSLENCLNSLQESPITDKKQGPPLRLKSVLTQDLSPEKDGDYTCSVPYDTYPHQDVLNLKVLSKFCSTF